MKFYFKFAFITFFLTLKAHAVVNGAPLVEKNILRSIVQIISTNGEYCTGIIISPKVILTAGHCMDRKNVVFDPFIVNLFKTTDTIERTAIGIVGISSLSDDIGKDYGMIFLSNSIYEGTDVTLRFAENISPDDEFCVVGQGLDENDQIGKMKIRCGLSYLSTVPGNMVIIQDNLDSNAGGGKGDSGGPVMRRNADGTFEVVGIFTNSGKGLFGATTNQGWFVPIYSPEVKNWISQTRCSSINMQKFDDSCVK